MQTTAMKFWAYIILLTLLGITGNIIAKAVEYYAIPQHTCNFVYGIIITIFVIENWSLLTDISYYSKHQQEIESHIAIIKTLTEKNNRLMQHNVVLTNEIMRINTAQRERGDEAIKCIINWKYMWDSRTTPPDVSSAMSFSEDINESRNTNTPNSSASMAPKNIIKVPPINQEDSL